MILRKRIFLPQFRDQINTKYLYENLLIFSLPYIFKNNEILKLQHMKLVTQKIANFGLVFNTQLKRGLVFTERKGKEPKRCQNCNMTSSLGTERVPTFSLELTKKVPNLPYARLPCGSAVSDPTS
jgi:hypothetical protein